METFRLIACQSLSHQRRTDNYIEPGKSVGECLRDLGWKTEGLSARVYIDGVLIPDAEWETVEPQAGQAVVVRRIPQGRNFGEGKQIIQIVAMLALVVAAVYAPGYILALLPEALEMGLIDIGATAAIQAAVLVSGSLALNARIPTPLPRRALPRPVRELKEAA